MPDQQGEQEAARLAAKYKLHPWPLHEPIDPPLDVVATIPRWFCVRHLLLPALLMPLGKLRIIVADPCQVAALDRIRDNIDKQLSLAVAPANFIVCQIERLYGPATCETEHPRWRIVPPVPIGVDLDDQRTASPITDVETTAAGLNFVRGRGDGSFDGPVPALTLVAPRRTDSGQDDEIDFSGLSGRLEE